MLPKGGVPFSIVDQNGQVLSKGFGMHTDMPLPDGCRLVRKIAPDNSYLVGRSTWVPIPAQPSPRHVFDWVAKVWRDPRTIEQLREERWWDIKSARAARIAAGVDVGGLGRFDADAAAVTAVIGQLAVLDTRPDDWSIAWTRHDNTSVLLSRSQLATVAQAVIGHGPAMHAISQSLRRQLNAATTPEAIEAVVWPT